MCAISWKRRSLRSPIADAGAEEVVERDAATAPAASRGRSPPASARVTGDGADDPAAGDVACVPCSGSVVCSAFASEMTWTVLQRVAARREPGDERAVLRERRDRRVRVASRSSPARGPAPAEWTAAAATADGSASSERIAATVARSC